MKTKLIKSSIAALLTFALLIGSNVTATAINAASSPWATKDVYAASVFGMREAEWVEFAAPLTLADFADVHARMSNHFGVVDQFSVKDSTAVTRGEVVAELYDIIAAVLNLATSGDTTGTDYFVENELLFGYPDGELYLDNACSKQEMFVLAKRVFEHIAYALKADARGYFWKVSDGDNTVYLLGSVHITDGSVYPLSKNIMGAFYDSDIVAVEANIVDISWEDYEYMNAAGAIPGDGVIQDFISPETYEMYAAFCDSWGLPPDEYNKLTPWAAAQMILFVQAQTEGGNSSELGVDYFFLMLAMFNFQKPMQIVELESVREQTDLFSSFSPELQETFLLGVLNAESDDGGVSATAETLAAMLDAWKAGEGIEKFLFVETKNAEQTTEFYSKLNDLRNLSMIEKISAYLSEPGTDNYFVIAGTMHMLKENGIVNSLAKLGYTVERL
jgi:uncharacterized protein YbaP (TraB family)